MKQILVLLFTFSFGSAFAQTTDCTIAHQGKFKDISDFDKTAYTEIDGDWMMEYSKNETEYIRSRIDRTDDCHYTITLAETNIKNFEVPIGTKLKVQILNVDGNKISYQYLPAGLLKPHTMIKLED